MASVLKTDIRLRWIAGSNPALSTESWGGNVYRMAGPKARLMYTQNRGGAKRHDP